MKNADISKVLERIQNQIEKLEDREIKEILSDLYNLVEDVFSDKISLLVASILTLCVIGLVGIWVLLFNFVSFDYMDFNSATWQAFYYNF